MDLSEISIDRDAEIPIGVQIVWFFRARIRSGDLAPGDRLPGLRDLAEATGVNINTVKTVYQRLHAEGLIDSQQGSGTFVGSSQRQASDAARIAISAAQAAGECGVDPREVAAFLYVTPQTDPASDQGRSKRQALQAQIAVLERAFLELDAMHPGLLAPASPRRSLGPSLLSTSELEDVRSHMLRRLLSLQRAIDENAAGDEVRRLPAKAPARGRSRKAEASPKRPPRPQRPIRPATADG
jgi:DNA-binding transcriptional regulator YhcF (GntR family)